LAQEPEEEQWYQNRLEREETLTGVTLSLFYSWSNLNEQTASHPEAVSRRRAALHAGHAAEAAKGAGEEEATTQAPIAKKAVGLSP
jgi:hypothetical protein